MMRNKSNHILDIYSQWIPQLWLTGFLCLSSMLFSVSSQAALESKGQLSSRIAALPAVTTPEPCNLDFDGNGEVDALTDGILFTRYLSGYTDTALVNGALGAGATRTTGAEVIAFLDQADCTVMKDVDGDGATDPLTDGMLLMRYLFGFSAQALIDDALSATATRTTDTNIQNWLAFYEQPRYVIIAGIVAMGERISDPWEDLVFVGVGPGNSTVRVIEGSNYLGDPMLHWEVTGDGVNLEFPNPNLLANTSQISMPLNHSLSIRETDDYPVTYDWIHAKGYFSGHGSNGLNRVPMSRATSIGGIATYTGTSGYVSSDWSIDETYRLTCNYDPEVEGCYQQSEHGPVLFIHGFRLGSNTKGGGEATWGEFPQLIKSAGYAPFEFRWNTSARFKDVAKELGLVVEFLAGKTGREVHLVAHSFGGLLVRTMLQQQAYDNNRDYGRFLASVVTLGSPHSGISDGDGCLHGTEVPWGQDDWKFEGCDQLSCQQAGEDIIKNADDAAFFDVKDNPGELIAALAETTNLLPDVDFKVLIGLSTPRLADDKIDNGDGLITGWGERFRPADATSGTCSSSVDRDWNSLLDGSEVLGSARVTEDILGFDDSAQPGGTNPDSDFMGYRHNTGELDGFLNLDFRGILPEVNIECGTGDPCERHDGYKQTAAWLAQHPSKPINKSEILPITLHAVNPLGGNGGLIPVTVYQQKGEGIVVASGFTDSITASVTLEVPFEANHTYGILIDPIVLFRPQFLTVTVGATLELSLLAANLGDIVLVPIDETPGQLSGQVTEGSLGGAALADVHISISRTDHTWQDAMYITDARGLWGPFDLIPGAYETTYSKSAYQTSSTTVMVQPNEPTVANHFLEPGQNDVLVLNDTGITTCSNETSNSLSCPVANYPGQDAEYGRDVTHNDDTDGHAGFSFTKLDASGNPLPPSATSWSCVRDNVTSLIWEVKTDDGGLQDKDNTYTWYNPDGSINGGDAGTQNGGSCTGSDCDTQGYVQAINTQALCGANDWRMPSKNELRNIVSLYQINPTIDTDYFPNTREGYSVYWSSSPYAKDSDYAWFVFFLYGGSGKDYKFENVHVRLVRD